MRPEKTILYSLAFILILLSQHSFLARVEAAEGERVQKGFGICLTTNKAVYAPGEVVEMTLEIINRSSEGIILQFKDSQRYDFVLEGPTSKRWQWSAERMFAQMLGEEHIEPGETRTYTTQYSEGLSPGIYRITGTIVATGMPLMASTVIWVR